MLQRCLASPPGKRAVARRQNSFETIVCDTCCSDDHCNYGGCGADRRFYLIIILITPTKIVFIFLF